MIAQFVRCDLLSLQQCIQGSRIIVKPCVAAGDVNQETSPPFAKVRGQPTKIHLGNIPGGFPGTAQLHSNSDLVNRDVGRPEHCAKVGTVFTEPIGAASRSLEGCERLTAVAAALRQQQCSARPRPEDTELPPYATSLPSPDR